MKAQDLHQPVNAIVAMSKNRVIGSNNQLPWHLPADLKHFKHVTTGHIVIMGRKTYSSIGRKLPNRINIIVTRNENFDAPGCLVAHSLTEALQLAQKHCDLQVFIIGGSEIFQQALPLLQKVYLTLIEEEFNGDTFFPELAPNEWQEVHYEHHGPDQDNKFAYSFIEYARTHS